MQPGLDAFSVLASDGLWGWCSDQEAVDCVQELLNVVRTVGAMRCQGC